MQDVEFCLREVHRVLKPGGEIRLSGPRKDTNLRILFNRIKKELVENIKLEEVANDYAQVLQINERKLQPMLFRWTTPQIEDILINAGFSKVVYSSNDLYAGQSMFICAEK